MALKVESIVDGSMHAEKTLGRAHRLEALHFVLSSSHRLMRIFGSVGSPGAPVRADRLAYDQPIPDDNLACHRSTTSPESEERSKVNGRSDSRSCSFAALD